MTTIKSALAEIPELKALAEGNPAAGELLAKLGDAADGVLAPWVLRSEAVQMLARVGELLDQADAAEQGAELAKSAAEAENALQVAETEVGRLAGVVRERVEAERLAADRYASAQEHARECGEQVEDLARDGADPVEQTQAILRRNAAEQVAGQFRAVAEQAAAERVAADAARVTAQAVVREAKASLKAARGAAQNPVSPGPSYITLLLDGPRRVDLKQTDGWSAGDWGIVADVAKFLAHATGAEKTIRRDERARFEREINERRSALVLPKQGHSLRPSDPGAIVPPPGVAPIAPRIG